MEGNLVIVESPAKAKTIQKFLGNGFVVKPSTGHIRDLHDNKLSIDVDHGFTPEYVVPAGKRKIVSELKKAADNAEVVWLASDEDREGEAISWHLQQTLGLDPARTRRIAFHEITKSAIQDAIKHPRDIDMNMVGAQQARRVLDRLVGFELSPILWRKIQRGLSAGRVQSVALRLVVDREKEIMAFSSEPYYKVDGIFNIGGTKAKGTLETKFETKDEARTFLNDITDSDFHVDSVDKKEGTRNPSAPFTTSTLQQEASRKLHFPVSLTMRLAQSLYERGLITYMRTDSTNLSSLAINTAREFINDNFGPEYSHPRQYKTHSKGAQEAHEAIRPTFITNTSIEGTAQEQKLYSLIWKRTLASQMSEAGVLGTTIRIASDKRTEKFIIQASRVLFDGFLKIYMEGSDDVLTDDNDQILPEVSTGQVLPVSEITASCKFSQPPFRYSEATLIKKLEELGIGRPSTYAPTITTLTTGRGYIIKGDCEGKKVEVENLKLKDGRISSSAKTEAIGAEKGKLRPQEIGMIVTDYLTANFSDILDYDFTANVEKNFDKIADGECRWNDSISEFYVPFHKKVEAALNDRQFSHVSRELGTDPQDGKKIVARFGQYGPFVQKGEGEDKQYASLQKGQLIETLTLEEALKLFQLPRRLGSWQDAEITVLKGRYGPYLKHGDKNISLPRGCDPLKITLEEAIDVIGKAADKGGGSGSIKEFAEGEIKVLKGRYGPYIKYSGSNYRIPKGTDASLLSEEDCRKIIESSKK